MKDEQKNPNEHDNTEVKQSVAGGDERPAHDHDHGRDHESAQHHDEPVHHNNHDDHHDVRSDGSETPHYTDDGHGPVDQRHEAPNPFDAAPVPPVLQPVEPASQPPMPPRPVDTMPQPVPPVPPAVPALGEFRGLKGWLVFFMVVFGLNGLGFLGLFVMCLSALIQGDGTAATVVGAVMTPVVGVVMLLAAVNIAMRKRLGKTMSQAALVATSVAVVAIGVTSLVSTLSRNTCEYSPRRYSGGYYYSGYIDTDYDCYGMTSSEKAAATVEEVGTIIIQLVIYGLVGLYFQKSRRVRETLVE